NHLRRSGQTCARNGLALTVSCSTGRAVWSRFAGRLPDAAASNEPTPSPKAVFPKEVEVIWLSKEPMSCPTMVLIRPAPAACWSSAPAPCNKSVPATLPEAAWDSKEPTASPKAVSVRSAPMVSEPAHQEIAAEGRTAPAKNVDETGGKEAGAKRWLWAAV